MTIRSSTPFINHQESYTYIRYEESEQEINEISDEKDRLREEKNEILLKFNKQIEVERADRRAAKAEADKSHVRVRQLEMEIQNLQNKVLDKEKDNQQITIVTLHSTTHPYIYFRTHKDYKMNSIRR